MKGHRISRLPLFGAEVLTSVPPITGFHRGLLDPTFWPPPPLPIVHIGFKFRREVIESNKGFKTATHPSALIVGDVRKKTPRSEIPNQPRNAVDLVDVFALMTRQAEGQPGPLDTTTIQGTGWVMSEDPKWAGIVSWWHPSKRVLIPSIGEIDYGPDPGWVFEALPTTDGEWCLNGMKIVFRWF